MTGTPSAFAALSFEPASAPATRSCVFAETDPVTRAPASHDRYDYTPIRGRPRYLWPNGAGLAVYIAVNLEHFAFGEGLGAELAPGGLVRATTRPIPLCGRNLPLSDALFERDALCFLDCKSRSLAFVDASGASITMEYPSFQHVGLWMRPGAPYLCLEPWTGYSDPAGFTGDLFDKPGMRVLEPEGRARHEARFIFRPE